MRKTLTVVAGAIIGALLMYFCDPERGRSRRVLISDQVAARGRDLSEMVRKRAEYQKGRARGIAHDVTKGLRTEQEYDDQTLAQKVRSEVLGYWDGSEVEVEISDGMVELTGSVDDPPSRDRLLNLVGGVDGVDLIHDRLEVGS